MRIREKLDQAILDFGDINLGSETARNALIDRIIDIVQREPVDPKYWDVNEAAQVAFRDSYTGEIIQPD
tara:strand:- start:48 stop:254 length:207 start_codon:yes stop_codon:yes gene_type:complete